MRTIKMFLCTGFAGCKHEDECEVEDDATDEEINDIVSEWALERIEWFWKEGED